VKRKFKIEPWVIFALGGMLGLSCTNFMNSQLTDLGLKVMYYYNVGPLLICTLYFMLKSTGCLKPRKDHAVNRNTAIFEARKSQALIRNDEE
jgi:uncharacterized membrane protein YfcA